MKASKYIVSLLALGLLAVSCSKKEDIQPGPQDWSDSQLFYFPTQAHLGSNELEPADDTYFTFKAMRKDNSARKVIVPTVKDTSEAKVFSVEPIVFEKGQTETEFKVSFDKAQIGINYGVTISVEGPQNVSYYSTQPTTLSFEVIRVQWNYLGKAKYRDDFISTIWVIPNKYAEADVDIYEREDMPGYYRFPDLYTKKLLADLFGRDENNVDGYYTDESTVDIDATDPTKVKIKPQPLGVLVNGFEQVGSSYSPEYWVNGDSYGTMDEGVLTFPSRGLTIEYQSGSITNANANGMFRLVLPGYTATDYILDIEAGHSDKNGVIRLSFDKSADVKTIVYQIFEGRLNDTQVSEFAMRIADGSLAGSKTLAESKSVSMTFDKTGIYTAVAVGLDKNGESQVTASRIFGYVAPGEEASVILNAGLDVNDRYAPQGNTSENSMQYYINGQDILELYYGLYDRADVDAGLDDIVAVLTDPENENAVPDTTLAKINAEGISGIFTGLAPGTEYVLVVVADNGYVEQTLTFSNTTGGEYNEVYRKFSDYNLRSTSDIAAYEGVYNYYAKDRLAITEANPKGDPQRKYIGQVTVTSDKTTGRVWFKGLFPRANEALGMKADTVYFSSSNNGTLLHYDQTLREVTDPSGFILYPWLGVYGDFYEQYYDRYGSLVYLMYYSYSRHASQLMEGGFVGDGRISFVTRYSDVDFCGLGIMAYFDPRGNSLDDVYAIYNNILLVKPEVDNSGLAPETDETTEPAGAPRRVRTNMVELPEPVLKPGRAGYTDIPVARIERSVKVASYKAAAETEGAYGPVGTMLLVRDDVRPADIQPVQ